MVVEETQITLCPGISAVSGLAVELGGFGLVLLHAPAHLIAQAQRAGGWRIASLMSLGIQLHSLGHVPFGTIAVFPALS